MTENFEKFVIRNRFRLTDIWNHLPRSKQDYALAKAFPSWDMFWLIMKDKELKQLNYVFALAEYVAEYETSEPEGFSRLASTLNEDEWNYVLQFCPFQKVDAAQKNLDLIVKAMEESHLLMSTAMAGMEFALTHSQTSDGVYERERSRATIQIFNFIALYASYIDVCYRIRNLCDLKKSATYARAVQKLTARNQNAHAFIKDLRNYVLHYSITEPDTAIHKGEENYAKLFIKSDLLLFSGYEWKAGSQKYLQEGSEVDLLKTVKLIMQDITRVVQLTCSP